MSQFGQRLQQNSRDGTDHGKGGLMMVLGAGVSGAYSWSMAGVGQSGSAGGLLITTDCRQILAELMQVRLGQSDRLAAILPGYNPGANPYLGVLG